MVPWMVLGKLSVPWYPTSLDSSGGQGPNALVVGAYGLFGHFSLVYRVSLLYPSLGDGPI